MGDEYSLGSLINRPGEKPIELQHWSSLPWAEATSLNAFYKLANEKRPYISLVGVEINEENLSTLGVFISSTESLIGICFSKNDLGDIILKKLLTIIFEDGGRQIEVLAINDNNLTTTSAKTIGKLIGDSVCNIRRLSLAKNALKDSFAKSFAKFLRNNDSIYELDLADSQIGFPGISGLSRVMKFNTTILQLHLEEVKEETVQDLTNLQVYSTRLLNTTKAGKKMKAGKRRVAERLVALVDKCIDRNLRIRFAKSRCADILRKGAYPVKLQTCRIALVGAEKSGKTGVAHGLLNKIPVYYPAHHPTVSLATAVLQTFQPESMEFDKLMENLQPNVSLDKKEKYYSKRQILPFDTPALQEVTQGARKPSKLTALFTSKAQIWRAKRRKFEGLVAICAQREAKLAAEDASPVEDDTLEGAGRHLFCNPESINHRIEELAAQFFLNAFDLDRTSVLLPKKQLDQLSVGSWNEENGVDVGATLAVAVNTREQVGRLDYLLLDDNDTMSLNTRRELDTDAGSSVNRGADSPSHIAKKKYGNFRKVPNRRFPEYEGAPKVATSQGISYNDTMFFNPMVQELSIKDIAGNDILFRSHFADTCVFNLFDLGGGETAQMLAKFTIAQDCINLLVFDMERAAKADLGKADVIREELTLWYRLIELYAGKNPTLMVVGTRKDTLDHLASSNMVGDRKNDFGRLTAGTPGLTMKRNKVMNREANLVVSNILQSINQDIVLSVVRDDNMNLLKNEKQGLAFFPVSNFTIEGIASMKSTFETYTRDFSTKDSEHVPLRWVRLLELAFNRYNENTERNYRLRTKALVQLAMSIGFSCKMEVQQCLKKFDQLGFLQFTSYNYELCSWVILDPVPIFKSLLKFAQNHRVDLGMPPQQSRLEEKFGNELVLLRNHGILRKSLFEMLWQGGREKEDLNFGISWLKQHYFMTEMVIDGERFFFFPSFLRGREYFSTKTPYVSTPPEAYFFAISFNQNGYIPPALLPRLIVLMFGCTIQENNVASITPLREIGKIHPGFNLFSSVNTSSRVVLTKDFVRIQFGGQIISMTTEGNELIFGLSQARSASRIVLMIHSMLSKLNHDVFCGRVVWDIIFFQSLGTSKKFSSAKFSQPRGPPRMMQTPRAGYNTPRSTMGVSSYAGGTHMSYQSAELVAYESDEDEETVVGVTGKRVRMSFNEARSKKLYPFFYNDDDTYETCHSLWKGARNSAEAMQNFQTHEMTESVDDYCNLLKQKYLSTNF